MYARSIILKIVIFVTGFSLLFWTVRYSNIFPQNSLNDDIKSIPVVVGLGNFLFSIISGFVIQTQWSKWDNLMDSTRGEVSMLRQLYVVAHHFPLNVRNNIRFHIYRYLDTYHKISSKAKGKDALFRSKKVDNAMIRIEDTMFDVSKRYPEIGTLAFSYLTRAMEYREVKLQSSLHKLPLPIKIFLIFATGCVIFGSLLIPFIHVMYSYYITLMDASLAFGIMLIIDDFDNPFRPGIYYLSTDAHKDLQNEIRNKLEYYAFDFNKAEEREIKFEKEI